MHNPFQSYQTDPTAAMYAGMGNPFSLPYASGQTGQTNAATFNPLAAALCANCGASAGSQLGQTGYAGTPNYGNIPQHLQLASWLTSQSQGPQTFGPNLMANWQNPYTVSNPNNPWLTAGQQNPQQNPLLQQMVAHLQHLSSLHGQQGLPYGQMGQQGSSFAQQGQQNSPFGPFGQQGSPFGQQSSPFGQQGSPYGQQGSPFGQQGSPFGQFGQQGSPYGQTGSPLAPQSWIGQGGQFGQALGQIHPLIAQQLAQQLGLRAFQVPGTSPWAGF